MSQPIIILIAAIDKNRALGKDGDLLWKISDDLKRFRELTRGHPVIMGRKTWESLPTQVRPMPGRTNIVITRQMDYQAPGATVVSSIADALAAAKAAPGADEAFVIGGGTIYTESLPFADRLYLTLIDAQKEGDAFFPPYKDEFTKETFHEERVSPDGIHYSWVNVERS
jgi:dihydrofolate reductase